MWLSAMGYAFFVASNLHPMACEKGWFNEDGWYCHSSLYYIVTCIGAFACGFGAS